jgi:hypothetical protein
MAPSKWRYGGPLTTSAADTDRARDGGLDVAAPCALARPAPAFMIGLHMRRGHRLGLPQLVLTPDGVALIEQAARRWLADHAAEGELGREGPDHASPKIQIQTKKQQGSPSG